MCGEGGPSCGEARLCIAFGRPSTRNGEIPAEAGMLLNPRIEGGGLVSRYTGVGYTGKGVFAALPALLLVGLAALNRSIEASDARREELG